jgi:uncharacterized protein YcbK (DUF882 family)
MMERRQLLAGGLALATAASTNLWGSRALAFPEPDVRRLGFLNLHTGETLDVAYWEGGAYIPDAMQAVNHVLRDFRTGDVHSIEPRLLDLLTALSGKLEARERFDVISGYRSPLTNAALHERSAGVAAKSLHMEGKAIDIRLAGVALPRLRDAALSLQVGGVGFYPTSDFVHVDVGRVRRWDGT